MFSASFFSMAAAFTGHAQTDVISKMVVLFSVAADTMSRRGRRPNDLPNDPCNNPQVLKAVHNGTTC